MAKASIRQSISPGIPLGQSTQARLRTHDTKFTHPMAVSISLRNRFPSYHRPSNPSNLGSSQDWRGGQHPAPSTSNSWRAARPCAYAPVQTPPGSPASLLHCRPSSDSAGCICIQRPACLRLFPATPYSLRTEALLIDSVAHGKTDHHDWQTKP